MLSRRDPTEARRLVFARSYDEVLLFLKHEDDKINRVLTALAFLTAAAVTLYIFSRGNTPPEALPIRHTSMSAADFFFASFLIGLVLALLSAISALDPTSFYPRFIGPDGEPESLLYFRAIGQGERQAVDGKARWDGFARESDDALRARLANSLHLDARRLSHRAKHKVYRFTECNAFVNAAVVSLGLLGISRLDAGSSRLHWWIIEAVLAAYAVAPLYDYWVMVRQNFPDVGREYSTRPWRPIVWLFFLPLLGANLSLLIGFVRDWPALTYVLASIVLMRLLSLHGQRWTICRLPFPLVLSIATALGGGCIAYWVSTW